MSSPEGPGAPKSVLRSFGALRRSDDNEIEPARVAIVVAGLGDVEIERVRCC